MAKHWKSFVKKEKTSEEKEEFDIKTLLSSGGNTDKSLEDVAEFNTSLKSLLEEQKELEDKMAELTGKKATSPDKKYDHEIKTIDQKKKEEKKAEKITEKRKKRRKEKGNIWNVAAPKKVRMKKKGTSILGAPEKFISNKKERKNTFLQAKENIKKTKTVLQETKKKVTDLKTIPLQKSFSKIKKEEVFQVVKKGRDVERNRNTILREVSSSVAKKKEDLKKSEKVKKVGVAYNNIRKEGKRILDFVGNGKADKSKREEVRLPEIKEHKIVKKGIATIGKTVQTYKKTEGEIKAIAKEVQKGLKALESEGFEGGRKGSAKETEMLQTIGKKTEKVTALFDTTNKYLEKTNSVDTLFQKKKPKVNFLQNKEKKSQQEYDLDFIQKKKEKEEFYVGNKKLQVDQDTINSVKKGMELLNNTKNIKDSFSF